MTDTRERSIDVREVVNAVGELLQTAAGDKPVSVMTGPEPAPAGGYCVVEIPGGDPLDADLAGESGGWLRLRTVCVSHTRETAWMEATWLKHVLRNALLDRDLPIAGDGWVVTGRRHDADAGTEYEGGSVNSWDDYGLLVEPTYVKPEPKPPPPGGGNWAVGHGPPPPDLGPEVEFWLDLDSGDIWSLT
ncbi:MAG: hypothetical protein J2P16_00035 [Mycobacterium sp.]|nr:hypothetical protein [Mycobacterium sp.]